MPATCPADIAVDLQERLSAEIARAVHENIADIGVISAMVPAEGLETLPYKHDQLVLVVPQGHVLDAVRYVHFAETLAHDFVGLDAHSATHSLLQHEMAQLGRTLPKRIQVGSFDATCRMVEAGVGIGVIPEMVAKRMVKSMRIRTVQLLDPWAARELRICVRRQSELPIFARELIDFILNSTCALPPVRRLNIAEETSHGRRPTVHHGPGARAGATGVFSA